MADYSILITDVTNYGDLRCVAGWDLKRGKMIRPEPWPGSFWPSGRINKNEFFRGAIATFSAFPPTPETDYPHFTEDRVVKGSISSGAALSQTDRWKALTDSRAKDLDALFGGNLVYTGSKAFVARGTKCASLGGIEIDPKGVVIEDYKNQNNKTRLRVWFSNGGQTLAPNLTSSEAHDRYQKKGLKALNDIIANAKRLHLRIGLARGFPAMPDRCYLQINGIYTSPK